MTTTNRKKPWKKWGGIVAAVVLAYWLGGFRDNVDTSPESVGEARLTSPDAGEGVGSDATIWTCAMHPQIRMPAPGQ